jgi:hypothetical protein
MGWIWGNDERALTPAERTLIQSVFRTAALPALSEVRIRNGLATTGTPFTTLGSSSLKLITGFPSRSKGKYQLMVGPTLFASDLSKSSPSILVHEMTHVWQYKHETLTEFSGLARHAFYYLSGLLGGKNQTHLYTYKLGKSWNEMGFEGQAQLVEDWYRLDQMSEESDRWLYVKNVLLIGNVAARDLTLDSLR